jgi:hypothetical protein
MRLGRVRSRRACSSVCHPERRSPLRPIRRTPIRPTLFRFAGFSTERRFARVARSEVEGPAFCLSSWARSPRRPSRRTAILPTHFRFAGFSTERRFARVARSEVEGPALLSVTLSGGRRSDRVEGPLYCPLTFASQVFRRSGGSRELHESEHSHFITFSLLSPPAERTAEKPRARMCFERARLHRLRKNSVGGFWWKPPASAGGSWTSVQRKSVRSLNGLQPRDFSSPALKRAIKTRIFPPHKCGGSHQQLRLPGERSGGDRIGVDGQRS